MDAGKAATSATPGPMAALIPGGVLRKVAWRLLPFLCLLYVFNIIDRANVGFARRTMQPDLAMSDAVYSFGYGVFYFGYLLFEVPANLLLRRVGARRWIARIMISWGLVSCATLAVTGPWSFYAVRTLLGVAEAGFFPGIILYLTYWFPARERARVMALFMTAIAFAGVLSNPLSGAIMQYLGGVGGLRGWQWIFLIEGLPSVVLGFVVLFYLPDGPARANWLTWQERAWLVLRLEEEDQARRRHHGADLWSAVIDRRVWRLICVYFTVAVGSNAAGAYFPTRIGQLFRDESDLGIGLLAALPHGCAIVAMTLLSMHSDRTGERRGHVALAAFAAAAGWLLSLVAPWPSLTLAGFCLAQAGMMSMLPVFWTIPTAFLSGAAAAGGIALINSVANIGGMLGANIYDLGGPGTMAVTLCTGGILSLYLRTESTTDRRTAAEPGPQPIKR
jgi:MFS transporter, ACS family, tartrate transporter